MTYLDHFPTICWPRVPYFLSVMHNIETWGNVVINIPCAMCRLVITYLYMEVMDLCVCRYDIYNNLFDFGVDNASK